MKKILLFSAATLIFGMAANAQTDEVAVKKDITGLNNQEAVVKNEKKEEKKELRKLKGYDVGYQAKEEFYRDFGDIPVTKWERLGAFDEATFTKDGQTVNAFFDYDSELVGTTVNKSFTDLPSKAQQYISDKYKDYTVADVVFFDDNEYNETDMELYGQRFEDADNYFIELKNDNRSIVLQSNLNGDVFFFKQMK